MMRQLLFAALAAFVLAGEADAQSRQPPQPPAAEERGSPEQQQGGPAPAAITEEQAPAEESRDSASDEQEWRKGQQRITTALAVIAFFQFLLAGIAVRAAYVQARAYITVNDLKFEFLDEDEPGGPAVIIDVIVENTGKTPARKMASGARVAIAPPDAGDDVLTLTIPRPDEHVSDLGAGCKGKPVHDRRQISTEELVLLRDGKLMIFVLGTFLYKDTMGFRQSTRFRLFMEWHKFGAHSLYDHARGNHST